MKYFGILMVAGALTFTGATAQVRVTERLGTTETMNRVKPGMGVNSNDRLFFAEARVATVFNLRAAEIASRKANSNWAKEFAHFRAMDFTQNYGELKVIGSKIGMRVDKSLPRAWEARLDQIRNKNGTAFDNAFRTNFVRVNEQYSDQAEREVKRGNNSLIRNFAVTQGPVIRNNIKMAKRGLTKI
jgi:predicted outer membrane protein